MIQWTWFRRPDKNRFVFSLSFPDDMLVRMSRLDPRRALFENLQKQKPSEAPRMLRALADMVEAEIDAAERVDAAKT